MASYIKKIKIMYNVYIYNNIEDQLKSKTPHI